MSISKPHTSLRWFQFRLRTLLVAMLVFGCGLGWWAQRYRAARKAWEPILAIENVLESGVELEFENDVRSQGYWIEQTLQIEMPNKVVGIAAFSSIGKADVATAEHLKAFTDLRSLELGDFRLDSDEQFISIVNNNPRLERLSLANTRQSPLTGKGWEQLSLPNIKSMHLFVDFALPDAFIGRLSQLMTLEQLTLSQVNKSSWSDAEIQAIGSLHKLNDLHLSLWLLQDHQWRFLGNLNALKKVDFSWSKIADSDLQNLPVWHGLEELVLSDLVVSEKSLERLSIHPKLKMLSLSSVPICDEDISYLTSLPALESLDLKEAKITDDGLRQLQMATKLQGLCISDTPISDAGLIHLAKMQNLKSVLLSRTQVSKEGVENLQKTRPDLTVYWLDPNL